MPIEAKPEKNAILFVWFNCYSGILIKTPSKTLVIDPVDVRARSFQDVDVILLTHEHYDHLDPRLVGEIQKRAGCMVIADVASSRNLYHRIPPEKLKVTKPGDEIEIDEVTVRTEICNHSSSTSPVTFIITSEDEVKIFHTADSLPFPEMAEIGQREKVDIVFATVGIAAGASPETGFEIARLMKPQVAVPYHTNSTAYQNKFAEILRKELPEITCLIPENNKIYQVSKKT